LPTLLAIVAAAFLINAAASIDFQQRWEYTTVEILKRLLFACGLLIGGFAVSLRSLEHPDLDDRPAPWIYAATIVSLGVFMIHNLIEFAIFEPGPMFLFALLSGAALGVRLPVAPRRLPWWMSIAALAAASLAWILALALVAAPTIQAEFLAQDAALGVMGEPAADGQTRVPTAASMSRAVEEYQAAFAAQPLNADYAFQAGRAMSLRGDSIPQIMQAISAAIAADPSKVSYYRTRAEVELRSKDDQAAIADLKTALALDPNDVEMHIACGDVLADSGDAAGARLQYQIALEKDDLLDAAEPKRMTQPQREALKQKIDRLK
jgi:tetratricopeptide (TPR) repeat protein